MKALLFSALICSLLLFCGCLQVSGTKISAKTPVQPYTGTDEYGCNLVMGEQWCAPLEKCITLWNETCTQNISKLAKSYCAQKDVGAVYECGNYFAVVSTMPGAGTTYYIDDEEIHCPVVSPDAMSEQCLQFLYGSNCLEIDVCTNQTVQPSGQETNSHQEPAQTEVIVGNDKDEHGCIGSAGYSWCEAKQKCLRIWEEECQASNSSEQSGGSNQAYGSAQIEDDNLLDYTQCVSSGGRQVDTSGGASCNLDEENIGKLYDFGSASICCKRK